MSFTSFSSYSSFDRVPHGYNSFESYNNVGVNLEIRKKAEGETGDDELVYLEKHQEHDSEWLSDNGFLDGLYLNVVSPPLQSCHEELQKLASILNEEPPPDESEKTKPFVEVPPSSGILINFGSSFSQSEGENLKLPNSSVEQRIPKKLSQKLATGDILRLAGEKFVQSSSRINIGTSLLSLSEDDKLAMELVQNLLASAEKIGKKKYKSAWKLLSQCKGSSSATGTPVQRLVYYFSEALQEKIDRDSGKKRLKDLGKKEQECDLGKIRSKDLGKEEKFDMNEAMMRPNPTIIAHHKQMPYCQIGLFTAVQAITENVAEAKKVHIIDLNIKSGLQYTVLMQALASRSQYPIELLKVTAVGTHSKEAIENTGIWLSSFAQSMNLPFCFNIVMISDMLDLKHELFEIEDDEKVAVYSSFLLGTIIAKQDRLEALMKFLSDLNPCILALIDVEANHTSPVFVKRFTESLFFFGAYFDCLGDCMDSDDHNRYITESMYFGEGIRNIVAAESDERTIRHVNISVWKSFFARFGMVEEELSTASLYQASLIVKNYPCWSSCTFAMDDKCLTVGWKGTPLVSISAWKFQERESDEL